MRRKRVSWTAFVLAASLAAGARPLSASESAEKKAQKLNERGTDYSNKTAAGRQGSSEAQAIDIQGETPLLDAPTRERLERLKTSGVSTPELNRYIDALMKAKSQQEDAAALPGGSVDYGRRAGFDNSNKGSLREKNPDARRPAQNGGEKPVEERTPIDLRSPSSGVLGPSRAEPGAQTASRGFSSGAGRSSAGAESAGEFGSFGKLFSAPPGGAPQRRRGKGEGAAPAGEDGQIRSFLRLARSLIRNRHFEDAEEAVRSVLVMDPASVEALILLAQIRLEQGRYHEAIEAAGQALSLDPRNPDAYFLRALAFEQLGREDRKLMDLRVASGFDPARFEKPFRAASDGARLFDPAVGDSWRLLDPQNAQELLAAQAPPSDASAGKLRTALLSGGSLAACLLAGLALARNRRPSGFSAALSGGWGAKPPPAAGPPSRTLRAMATEQLRAGQHLVDKYKLVREIGRDGSVEVWRVHDRTLDRPAVVQRLYAGPERTDERFRRLDDARQAATLHHPNVTDIYEILDVEAGLFVVYEYSPGKTVRRILKEKSKLAVGQVRDILIPVCRALAHAHNRGVVHGGLSPERILVTHQGYVKVSNFVLARTTGVGVERYQAPECRRGDPMAVSDVYSLGLCCYEMLTGGLPDSSGIELEPRLAPLLEKTLDLDFRTRTASAKLFMRLLYQLPGGGPPPEEGDQPETDNEATA